MARPAEKAYHQLERAANYLRDRNPGDFIQDLNGLARRRPEILFGGLFILGLASARFLKASAPAPSSNSRRSSLPVQSDTPGRPGIVIAPELRESRSDVYPS